MTKYETLNSIAQKLRRMQEIKTDAAAALRVIRLDADRSEEYKLRAEREINADTMSRTEQLYNEIMPEVEALRGMMAEKAKGIDLNSTKLQNVLGIIGLAKGANIPESVQAGIVEQLQGDTAALEMLMPMFENAGMLHAAMDAGEAVKAAARDVRLPNIIEDGVYYETLKPETGDALDILIGKVEFAAKQNTPAEPEK